MPIKSGSYYLFALVAIIGSLLLTIFFWVVPHSILGWLALLIAGIPAWLFLEWLGETALKIRFFQRLSTPARILVGIPFVLALMALALLVAISVKEIVLSL